MRGAAVGFTARAGEALRRVLGPGRGVCWDVACGTGVHADTLRDLGWTVVGSDVSAGQLRHAGPRLPVFLADARTPPVRPGSADAAVAVLCHTDIEDYAGVCAAAAAAVRPGGRFAHVGIHPCFSGAFVDRSDPGRLVTTPGYWRRERRWSGWSAAGVRETRRRRPRSAQRVDRGDGCGRPGPRLGVRGGRADTRRAGHRRAPPPPRLNDEPSPVIVAAPSGSLRRGPVPGATPPGGPVDRRRETRRWRRRWSH